MLVGGLAALSGLIADRSLQDDEIIESSAPAKTPETSTDSTTPRLESDSTPAEQ